jgi:hypothetical protein
MLILCSAKAHNAAFDGSRTLWALFFQWVCGAVNAALGAQTILVESILIGGHP